jgi:hypothetical protein
VRVAGKENKCREGKQGLSISRGGTRIMKFDVGEGRTEVVIEECFAYITFAR